MADEVGWDHAIADIPDTGLTIQRKAATDELQSLAQALDLPACQSLEADYTIKPMGEGRYRLTGTLRAEVEQTCVVTLEPVSSEIKEPFDFEFWPQDDLPAPAGGELDLRYQPDPEPIVDGQLPVGRIVFECLAAAIDPFPRLPEAELDLQTSSPPAGNTVGLGGPFAALAKIKGER